MAFAPTSEQFWWGFFFLLVWFYVTLEMQAWRIDSACRGITQLPASLHFSVAPSQMDCPCPFSILGIFKHSS